MSLRKLSMLPTRALKLLYSSKFAVILLIVLFLTLCHYDFREDARFLLLSHRWSSQDQFKFPPFHYSNQSVSSYMQVNSTQHYSAQQVVQKIFPKSKLISEKNTYVTRIALVYYLSFDASDPSKRYEPGKLFSFQEPLARFRTFIHASWKFNLDYHPWTKYSASANIVDLVVFCDPGLCPDLPDSCVPMPDFSVLTLNPYSTCYYEPLQVPEISKSQLIFGFLAHNHIESIFNQYNYVMVSLPSVFLTPDFFAKPLKNDLYLGYVDEQFSSTANHLSKLAKLLGFKWSTQKDSLIYSWVAYPKIALRICKFALFALSQFSNLTESEHSWPPKPATISMVQWEFYLAASLAWGHSENPTFSFFAPEKLFKEVDIRGGDLMFRSYVITWFQDELMKKSYAAASAEIEEWDDPDFFSRRALARLNNPPKLASFSRVFTSVSNYAEESLREGLIALLFDTFCII